MSSHRAAQKPRDGEGARKDPSRGRDTLPALARRSQRLGQLAAQLGAHHGLGYAEGRLTKAYRVLTSTGSLKRISNRKRGAELGDAIANPAFRA